MIQEFNKHFLNNKNIYIYVIINNIFKQLRWKYKNSIQILLKQQSTYLGSVKTCVRTTVYGVKTQEEEYWKQVILISLTNQHFNLTLHKFSHEKQIPYENMKENQCI